MTELADLKMPGALEAVDGVLAQVDSAAVTAGEAFELVLNAPARAAQQRSAVVAGPHAGVRRLASPGGPAALVERRATLALVNRASRLRVVVLLPRSARQEKARTARRDFPYPAAPW